MNEERREPDDGHREPAILEPERTQGPQTYKVVGPHRVCGYKPGETFTTVLAADREAALIYGGHLAKQDTPRAPGGSRGGSKPPESKGKE